MPTSNLPGVRPAAPPAAQPTGPALSADVAAKVERALAPAAAGVKQLNNALTQTQAKLSGLGQLQSAIATFDTATHTLAGDKTAPADKLKNFVAAFNGLHDKLQALQKDTLKSDPAMTQVKAQIAQVLRDAGPGALAKAGITVDSSGNMQLDPAKAAAGGAAALDGLFTSDGRGVADRLAGKLAALASSSGSVGREEAATTRDVGNLETKRTAMAKQLTAQATALAAMYTQQAQAGAQDGKPMSLFDMMA